MYPFCTSNSKDFENLLSIHLDACFFPRLDYHDFLLNAWRVDSSSSHLQYSGLFFEETKSRLLDGNQVLLTRLMEEMYPGTCYSFQPSPSQIVELSYSELLSTHRKFYHPSNLTVFLYGNLNPDKVTDQIQESVLKYFQSSKVDTSVKLSKLKNDKPQVYIKIPQEYWGFDKERPCKMVKSFLLDTVDKSEFNNFLFSVLQVLMFDDPGCLLEESFIKSGLCRSFLPFSGFDLTTKQTSFTFGFDGVNPTKDQEIALILKKTLEKLVKEGIPKSKILSAMHHLEIQHREIKENYGLQLISSMIPYTLHTSSPLSPLNLPNHLKSLRSLLAQDEPVLESLIQQSFLNNTHSVQILATADKDFLKESEKVEYEKITSFQLLLTSETEEKLEQERQGLILIEQQVENDEVLPGLSLEDLEIERTEKMTRFDCVVGGLKVRYLVEPTNEVTYIRFKSDVSDLPEDLRELLPLYRTLINHLGSSKRSGKDFSLYKDQFTVAGLSTSYISTSSLASLDEVQESFLFKIAFLDRHLDYAFEILEEAFIQTNFNETQHITNLIQQDVRNRTGSIIDSGEFLCRSLAASSLTAASNSYETLSVLKHDTTLAASLISSLSRSSKIYNDISSRLAKIHSFILNRSALEVLVHTSSAASQKLINERLEYLENSLKLHLNDFKAPRVKVEVPVFSPFVYQVYFTLPVQVFFVAEAFIGCHFTCSDFPALKVLAEVLNSVMTEEMIGKSADFVSTEADFSKGTLVLSCQDRAGLAAFNSFEKCILKVAGGNFSEKDLKIAKIKIFAKLDKPEAVNEKGLDDFLFGNFHSGINLETFNDFRKSLVAVTREEVLKVSEKYLLDPLKKGLSSKVVFGDENISKVELKDAGWMVQSPIEIISNK
jgi:Zn-dependent M16 (insulinase) family peptidase